MGTTCYYVTALENLDSILSHGLVPMVGDRSVMLGEYVPNVYLFGSLDDVVNAGWFWELCDEDGEYVVLEVDVSGLSVTPTFGGMDSWEWTTDRVVGPERVRVLDVEV